MDEWRGVQPASRDGHRSRQPSIDQTLHTITTTLHMSTSADHHTIADSAMSLLAQKAQAALNIVGDGLQSAGQMLSEHGAHGTDHVVKGSKSSKEVMAMEHEVRDLDDRGIVENAPCMGVSLCCF